MTVRIIPVGDLAPHPKNPRQGDVGAIVSSIVANGWFGVIVAQAPTGNRKRFRILAGEHRWRAQRAINDDAGLSDHHRSALPTHVVDVDDETALRILLADNRTADLATYDYPDLAANLQTLVASGDSEALFGTGWDVDDLAEILADLDAPVLPDDPATGTGFPSGPSITIRGVDDDTVSRHHAVIRRYKADDDETDAVAYRRMLSALDALP